MRQVLQFVAILGLVGTAAACSDPKPGNATPEAATSAAAIAAPASATPPPAASSAATPPPAASASAAPTEPPPSASASATPAGSGSAAPAGSAAAGPKTFDCGAKGQKACPMQGWMKGVMGSATSAGDGAKMASALAYIAGKPIPGMGSWSAIASDGAAKAKAGDIDGAKASCKKCHDLYKEKYKTTMRDRPW